MEKKDIIQSFKDSLFTGLIALALFGPIVGLRTASKGEGLFITPQWGVVFLLVGLTPSDLQAISSSLKASQALPTGSFLILSVK